MSYLKLTEEWKTSEMEYNSEQTGLCNRIIFWELAYIFNQIKDKKLHLK